MRQLLTIAVILAVFAVLCHVVEWLNLGQISPYMLLIVAAGSVGYAVYGKESASKQRQ